MFTAFFFRRITRSMSVSSLARVGCFRSRPSTSVSQSPSSLTRSLNQAPACLMIPALYSAIPLPLPIQERGGRIASTVRDLSPGDPPRSSLELASSHPFAPGVTRWHRRAPGRTRTCDTRFRKPVLYPLSYRSLSFSPDVVQNPARSLLGLLVQPTFEFAPRAAPG